uniref:Exonuclease domain-containing protein n=1 Tax=Trypanosoma congolense (strain IL3000) TaxID=1068625 RepID=G0UKH4_TRYCI|nr:conserved hypothetical protein [Trypanosoma congolense IL3000]
MSPHNKRAMGQRQLRKERVAERHGQRPTRHGGSRPLGHKRHHHRRSQGSRGYRSLYDESNPLDRQLFDYLIVVDVEATCDDNSKNYPHEIIELPGVLVDVRRGIVDKQRSFHSYVRPRRNPILTPFCKALTGIKQEDVDRAPSLPEVVKLFEEWYMETIPLGAKVVLATDGPWDLKNFVYEHSVLRDHVSFPTLFWEYIDIRTTFSNHFNRGVPIKLTAMLHRMHLEFEGRQHCGFDDAVNIARLAVAMMRAGCVLNFLVAIPLVEKFYYRIPNTTMYRREEGSGVLDPDVVDDIAKKCFGLEYFAFGERHMEEVMEYRRAHLEAFQQVSAAPESRVTRAAKRHDTLQKGVQRRLILIGILSILIVFISLLCLYRKVAKNIF